MIAKLATDTMEIFNSNLKKLAHKHYKTNRDHCEL